MNKYKHVSLVAAILFLIIGAAPAPLYAESAQKGLKIAYVDLRRAFYEYDKAKKLEEDLERLTEQTDKKRTGELEAITKMRDQAEMLKGKAREKKQAEIEERLTKLQELDKESRQDLLTRKNDMFREVIEDIQKAVEKIGVEEGYDYVLDSRNIMYADEAFDLTDTILKQLNK